MGDKAMKRWCGLILAAGVLCGGCSAARYTAYLFAPRGSDMVKAEYDGLADSTVAVVVHVGRRVEYEYPTVRHDLAYAISAELERKVKGVRLVPAEKVIDFQDAHLNWNAMNRTEIARRLGADKLVLVSLMDFSTREPGSVSLYRGRIAGDAMVYQADRPERSACMWRTESPIRAEYPEGTPIGRTAESDYDIRLVTQALFTDRLAKKFYKHRPEEPS